MESARRDEELTHPPRGRASGTQGVSFGWSLTRLICPGPVPARQRHETARWIKALNTDDLAPNHPSGQTIPKRQLLNTSSWPGSLFRRHRRQVPSDPTRTERAVFESTGSTSRPIGGIWATGVRTRHRPGAQLVDQFLGTRLVSPDAPVGARELGVYLSRRAGWQSVPCSYCQLIQIPR